MILQGTDEADWSSWNPKQCMNSLISGIYKLGRQVQYASCLINYSIFNTTARCQMGVIEIAHSLHQVQTTLRVAPMLLLRIMAIGYTHKSEMALRKCHGHADNYVYQVTRRFHTLDPKLELESHLTAKETDGVTEIQCQWHTIAVDSMQHKRSARVKGCGC